MWFFLQTSSFFVNGKTLAVYQILIFPAVLNDFTMEGCLQQQQERQYNSPRPHKLNGGGSWRAMVMGEHAATNLQQQYITVVADFRPPLSARLKFLV